MKPAVYLSAIPAGTGKSASLAAFAAALCRSPEHASTGMLILCNRVSEVRDMAEALSGHRNHLHIICGDDYPEVRTLGDHETSDAAQIVIATQASLRASLRGQPCFTLLTRFRYLGAPRAVRCWDEAYSMRRSVIIDGDSVAGLLPAIRKQSPAAVQALLEWVLVLELRLASGPCSVPDFDALGVNFSALIGDLGDHEDLINQAKALRDVSGQHAWAFRDNLRGSSMVKHVPELPESLLPVFVTDASAALGVNHEAYAQMEASGMPLVRLKEAAKTYRNLTIRLVPTAASRSVYTDKKTTRGRALIEMAVRYVQSVAPEEVLVVSYKRLGAPLVGVAEKTIAAAINARLTADEGCRVRHLTWGQHTATNMHEAVRHVLLMGLNFLPPISSYAESSALLDKPMNTNAPGDHPTEAQVKAIAIGRLRDSTLQAILRGAARKGRNGDCGECEVVIPQIEQTGLTMEAYGKMFPGVVILQDRSLLPRKALKGRLGQLETTVLTMIAQGHREFTNQAIRETMRMGAAAFRKLVKHSDWQTAMGFLGVVPQMLSGGRMGLRVG